tara:strand:+ start:369 stop:905 length:537 start_codon:yes stop_codon:yes gene_type:complete
MVSDKVQFMRIAVYEPDIPQNLGAMMRLAACMGIPTDVVGPCGFPFSIEYPSTNKNLNRVVMDYATLAKITEHRSWNAFMAESQHPTSRLLLLTTSGDTLYTDFSYNANDTLLVGRESGGVPKEVHDQVDARIRIPLVLGARSLNVVVAAAMVLGEALRQTNTFPLYAGGHHGDEASL